jgi:predicted hydrocarbon binding protein
VNGVFHRGLKRFVVDEYGRAVWDEVRADVGVEPQVYLPVDARPDREFISLVEALPRYVDASPFDILEAFGERLAASLLETYGDRVVDDDPDVMALLGSLEAEVHAPLRRHDETLDPPRLACVREGPDRVTVVYESSRQLCPVAVGLVRGVGDQFGESLSVTEERCMHHGDERCELVVTRQ